MIYIIWAVLYDGFYDMTHVVWIDLFGYEKIYDVGDENDEIGH